MNKFNRTVLYLFVCVVGCGGNGENVVKKDGGGIEAGQTGQKDGEATPLEGGSANRLDGSSADAGGSKVIPTLDGGKPTCARNNGGCNVWATCDDSSGEVVCTCPEGYDGDGKNCWDINECADATLNDCDENATCENISQSYTCTCKEGFTGDGKTCTDVDECKLGKCDKNATCTNTLGGYDCECKTGFTGDGKTCTDIDECKGATNTCHPDAKCVNDPGSFHCVCNAGFEGDGFTCKDVDECADKDLYDCIDHAHCVNTRGSYQCACDKGFTGDGTTCTDVNECDSTPCNPDAKCTNTPGGFECHCNAGFEGDGILNCADINECEEPEDSLNKDDCSPDATCTNIQGGYLCDCNDGYEGDGFDCANINECEEPEDSLYKDDCSSNADCTDKIPRLDGVKYTCACKIGYLDVGEVPGKECIDVNECTECAPTYTEGCPCNSNATCANNQGGYKCTCKSGYQGDGIGSNGCVDIDECKNGAAKCHVNADCENTEPGYKCKCKPGFAGDGFNCEEIDECDADPSPCGEHAICTNIPSVPGTYDCECEYGYGGDPYTACVPLCDIAQADPDICDPGGHGICVVIDGVAQCNDCETPYIGTGQECHLDTNCTGKGCGPNTDCVDTGGGVYDCACKDGYEGDPYTGCTDINQCAKNTDNCDDSPDACVNDNPGTFHCVCPDGYSGNGIGPTGCVDIDECAPKCGATNYSCVCDPNATCANKDLQKDGVKYTCACNAGYTGDGKTCTDIDECAAKPCDLTTSTCTHIPGVPGAGGYTCTCKDGYRKQGDNCVNINECEEPDTSPDKDNCSSNANCTDKVPYDNNGVKYTCACKPGYRDTGGGDGTVCVDINECLEPDTSPDKDDCSSNATCTNTQGGYTCKCNKGYRDTGGGDGKVCVDINECEEPDTSPDKDDCSSNATCTNSQGGYTCKCNDGYQDTGGGDGRICTDIDECATKETNSCDCNSLAVCGDTTKVSYCVNNAGGYTCECKEGYQKQGGNCVNINECAPCSPYTSSCPCDPNATCTDKIPSQSGGVKYTCACNSGYRDTSGGNGTSCTDIQECCKNLSDCSTTGVADCGYGTNSCDCNPAVSNCTCVSSVSHCENKTGGFRCVDIDECNGGDPNHPNDCNALATCTNKDPGYDCACDTTKTPGLIGSGHNTSSKVLDGCYCDLTGWWAMSQKAHITWSVTGISNKSWDTTVWQLHHYDYNGQVIQVYKKGCGQKTWPEFRQLLGETYCPFIPNKIYDSLSTIRGVDVPLEYAVPSTTTTYKTPSEAVVLGINLSGDQLDPDNWPASRYDVPEADRIDVEGDGVKGLTTWSKGPLDTVTYDPKNDTDGNFEYTPTDFSISARVGCMSSALRMITHLQNVKIETCSKLTGDSVTEHSDGRVYDCTLVAKTDWEKRNVKCTPDNADDKQYEWLTATRCSKDQVDFFDTQEQTQNSDPAPFTLVKLSGSNPTCQDVRNTLP